VVVFGCELLESAGESGLIGFGNGWIGFLSGDLCVGKDRLGFDRKNSN
jgi:hypothetical protein